MKFKSVAKAHVGPAAVARIDFPEIEGCPWLEVRPAGESNKAFFNEALRQQAKDSRRAVQRGLLSVDEIAQERASAVDSYAKHVLTGNGGGWLDEETDAEAKLPLDLDSRLALLRQLPPDLFDRLRIFCNQLLNFRS